jgi:hypothetical protein
MPFISESLFQKSVPRCSKTILCRFQLREVRSQASIRTAQSCVRMPINVQKIRTVQGCISPDFEATRPNAHQSSTRNRISFSNTNMGRQLHPSGQQGNTVQMLSLIRKDVEKNCNRLVVRATPSRRDPYYGIYMQQKCNPPKARATPYGRGLDMVLREVHYGKPIPQLSVWRASSCVRTPPRENRISVDSGLL